MHYVFSSTLLTDVVIRKVLHGLDTEYYLPIGDPWSRQIHSWKYDQDINIKSHENFKGNSFLLTLS